MCFESNGVDARVRTLAARHVAERVEDVDILILQRLSPALRGRKRQPFSREGGLAVVRLGEAVRKCRPVPRDARYSRGADDTAKSAPTMDRRDAPTSSNKAPPPSASQFSASLKEVGPSYKTIGGHTVLSESACCVPSLAARHHICLRTVLRPLSGELPKDFSRTPGWQRSATVTLV